MARIEQLRGRDSRKYETVADGIQAEYCIGGHYRSYKVPYESIDFDEIVSGGGPTPRQRLLFASVALNLIGGLVIGLFLFNFANWSLWVAGALGGLFSIPLIVWGRQLFRRRTNKLLEGSEDLFFFYAEEHHAEVDDFIAELKQEKTRYLHRKYLKIDRLLPLEEQKASVDWLYQNKQIERRIYQIYLEEYEHLRLLRGN